MRYLIYADLQASDGDEMSFTQPNKSLQHCRVEQFFDDISRIYTEHKCRGVIDLGDTTDDRSSIPMPTVEILGTGMHKLPDGQHWKLTGNHEQYLRDTSVNNRRLFDHIFKVVDGRQIQMMGDWAAFFVSYPADHAELSDWLLKESRRIRGPKVLFGHFQVKGAFYQGGTALNGVPVEALNSFNLVLLGHIHMPQAVSDKIHYVGSPFQQDWGESGQPKRVGIFDDQTLTVEWVPLTGYPMYREVTVRDFYELADGADEHRYRVLLNSHEDTELFFKHPRFSRAAAKYNYDDTPVDQQGDTQQDWSFEGLLRRHLKVVPPKKVGIELTDDEMIEVVDHILSKR